MKSHHLSKAVGPIVILCLSGCFTLSGQTRPKPDPQGMGGTVTGTPVNYASRRTVDVTDPKAQVVFEDVTEKTAMANFKHRSGTPEKNYIFEVPPVALAISDHSPNVWPHLYILNAS